MKIILATLIAILISGGLLVGGYTGKIPAVSNILGTNSAKDLGIDYSDIDVEKIHNNLGTELITNSDKAGPTGVKMEGSKEVKYTLAQEEISALINKSPFKHNPFSNAQVKINNDGSVEASAILKVETLFELANAMGYSGEKVKEQMEKYKIPVRNIPIYGNVTGYVKDNRVTADFSKISVARIPLPSFIIDQATPQIIKATEGIINSFPEFEAKSITFDNGKMNFEGSIPDKQYFE